jgi:glucose-6-phosphate isomerase
VTHVNLSYRSTAIISDNDLKRIEKQLKPELDTIHHALSKGYQTPYACINVPADTDSLQTVMAVADNKKKLNPRAVIVIGIGGSALGPQAVQEAVYGTFFNLQQPETALYFADTVDTDYIHDILLITEQYLQEEHAVLINIISKSGTTTETIANAQLFIELLKQYLGDAYNNYVMVTTDKGSALWNFAHEKKFTCLEIPHHVGGRYSVLTPVGLLPLALIGVDIAQLREGARSMLHQCMSADIHSNPAMITAACLYHHYRKNNIAIHDSFIFSVDLEYLGKWYRQLMGESIGKQKDINGNAVFEGITPTVSIGSSDLHSVAQLYLSTQPTRFTTFVTVGKNYSELVVPDYPEYTKLVKSLENKTLPTIMQAIYKGTTIAYQNNSLPFVELQLPEKSAWCIGQFLQYNMMQIIYLGYLLNINPFDQPQVELYKQETRKILAHE